MTIEERKAQNKRCFERIKELEIEMHEMETLIADNLARIYEAEHPGDGNTWKTPLQVTTRPETTCKLLLFHILTLLFLHRGRYRGTFCRFLLKSLAITGIKQVWNISTKRIFTPGKSFSEFSVGFGVKRGCSRSDGWAEGAKSDKSDTPFMRARARQSQSNN